MSKRWQKADLTYLRRYAGSRRIEELAERFRTDAPTVRTKLKELGLAAAPRKPAGKASGRPAKAQSAVRKARSGKPRPKAGKKLPAKPRSAAAKKPAARRRAPATPAATKAARNSPSRPQPPRLSASAAAAAGPGARREPEASRAPSIAPLTPSSPPPPRPIAEAAQKPPRWTPPPPARPAPPRAAPPPRPRPAEAEPALAWFEEGVRAMHGQTWTKAKRLFERVIAEAADEPELVDRAKLYLEACRQRLAEGAGEGEDPYLEAVVLKNAGHLDEALALCRRGGRHRKDERMAYLAASIHALRGEVAEAADLLGLAIELNPKNRVHVILDPDFAPVREREELAAYFHRP